MPGPTRLSGLTTTEETMFCASKLGYANFACTNQPTGLHEIDLSGLHGQPDPYMSTQQNPDRVKNECEVHGNFSRRFFQVKAFSHTVCYNLTAPGGYTPKAKRQEINRDKAAVRFKFKFEHQTSITPLVY